MSHTDIKALVRRCQTIHAPDLNLSGYALTQIPSEIANFFWLKKLNLSTNNLTRIPDFIFNLTGLTHLYLNENEIHEIPKEINRLKNLIIFEMRDNQLIELPDTMGELIKLSRLVLDGNRLAAVPQSFSRLADLKGLDLDNNLIDIFPEHLCNLPVLTRLLLNNNHIETVPEHICHFRELEFFSVEENPIKQPPPEIVTQGLQDIRSFYHELRKQGDALLYEAKMVILGDPGAGKTSLTRKILDPKYRIGDEASTLGIDIHRWTFPTSDQGREFHANIWDFGGQEVYHATHQFFLTQRTLYILVLDGREERDFHYWLSVVNLFSTDCPLIVLMNEKHGRTFAIDERDCRARYTNIKEFAVVDIARNRGLEHFVELAKLYLCSLKHVGNLLPKTWADVRATLAKDNRYCISQDEYFQICKQHGIVEPQQALQLSGYFHDLGTFLHFSRDSQLKHLVILKPEWCTHAVYKLKDNEQIVASRGWFTRSFLESIWYESQYRDLHDEMLALLMKFELCYKTEDEHSYILPELRPKSQPDYPWHFERNLVVCYRYKFMPKGLITHLIVRCHRYIHNQYHVWRSGVILRRNDTYAEVIESIYDREIRIRIGGDAPGNLMVLLTEELEKVHARFRNLEIEKEIPCTCSTCINSLKPNFFSYDKILRRQKDGKSTVECDIDYKSVDVQSLLEGMIRPKDETLVFISYHPRDQGYHDALCSHLNTFTNNGLLKKFSQMDVDPGDNKEAALKESLERAGVVLMLVSADYVNSEFNKYRLPELIRGFGKRSKKVLWVPIHPCLIEEYDFNDLVPCWGGEPISTLQKADQDKAWVEVCRQLKRVVLEIS